MARRRQSHRGLLIFFIVAAVIVVAGLGIYFYTPFEQSMLPLKDQCYVISSGTTQNSFSCDGGKCQVRASDTCNTKSSSSQRIVIARAKNALYGDRGRADEPGSAHWIALDNPYTDYYDMESWVMSSTLSSTMRGCSKNYFDVPYGFKAFISDCTGQLRLYIPVPGQTDKYYYYRQTPGADLDPAVKYDCQNQEMCSGERTMYACDKDIIVAGVKQTPMSYRGEAPGGYASPVFTLTKGQKFEASGAQIEWAVVDDSKACSVSRCNEAKTGYYSCSTGSCPTLSSSLTKCGTGEYCTQTGPGGAAVCGAPFDTSGEIKTGRTANEPITFEYTISSPTVSQVTVTYKLVSVSDRSKTLDIKSDNVYPLSTAPSKKTITFTGQGIGTYEIIVQKTYSGGEVADEVYQFVIGSALTTQVMVPQSPLTGTNLIVGSPFYVDVQALEGTTVVTELADFSVKATLLDTNNVVKSVTVQPGQIKSTPTGEVMRYTFIINEPGRFTFEATASKYGVPSTPKSRTVDIKPSKIEITFTNVARLINMQPGQQTVTFETKDPMGQYIDVQYHVELIPSGAAQGTEDIDVTNLVHKQSTSDNTGKYEFTYNFQTGTYVIEVSKVTAPGYTIESIAKSPSINVDPTSVVKECISSEDCSAGKVCINNSCVDKEPPYALYMIIAIIGIVVIVLIVVIVKMARRKQAPSLPMPGM